MLDKLDTFVAFATLMLGISLLITILNQMVGSLLGYRATYLKEGIKDLLKTLDSTLEPNVKKIATDDLEKIAHDVLTHELASDSFFAHNKRAPLRWRLATALRPEELTKLLMLVSKGQSYEKNIQGILKQPNPTVEREAKLVADTVNDLAPNARATADELIKQLSDKATKAVGRLEGAYSSTMDRVRQRFTLQMRIWTIAFSLTFALVYHLDVAKIYSQLSIDPALRGSLSKVSEDLMKEYSEVRSDPKQKKNLDDATKHLAETYKEVQSKLSESKLALFKVPDDWWRFKNFGEFLRILATAALLSLGAPFWYNMLKNLVNLRSQVVEQQQKEATA